ncbi:hypothetical protein A1F95_10716, partial [Pyrenophora tritici-repentis]
MSNNAWICWAKSISLATTTLVQSLEPNGIQLWEQIAPEEVQKHSRDSSTEERFSSEPTRCGPEEVRNKRVYLDTPLQDNDRHSDTSKSQSSISLATTTLVQSLEPNGIQLWEQIAPEEVQKHSRDSSTEERFSSEPTRCGPEEVRNKRVYLDTPPQDNDRHSDTSKSQSSPLNADKRATDFAERQLSWKTPDLRECRQNYHAEHKRDYSDQIWGGYQEGYQGGYQG